MRKGFTLIELLAVIVILAIIALISTPIIIGLIDDARKEAFINTAYGIADSGQIYFSKKLISGTPEEVTFTYTNGVESSSISGAKLDYNGSKPKSGNIIINSMGQVALAIYNGTYCAEKDYTDGEVILSDKSEAECVLEVTPSLYADASGASVPELNDGMIPIIYNGTNWVKADTSVKWYDYTSKEWANVVLVTEASRATYKATTAGTVINESDVLAYLVWVPRYRYKLFNVGALSVSPQTIEIEFETKTTTKSTGSANGTWLTHPAFTFGTSEVNGIWVGKFETTGTSTVPTSKPNVASLRSQTVSAQFTTAQLFNTTTTYGTTSDYDSHMMKNMEWGAVVYLTQSIYGKNSEIWINNSSTYTTGCAGSSVSATSYAGCQNAYNTATGTNASTTGNIYGIYDINGGVNEYVMGAMYNSNNTTIMVSSSGFAQATIDGGTMAKYIDKYTYGTTYNDQTAYNRMQLGDATGETRGWNSDDANFMYSTSSWLIRGGDYGNTTRSGSFSLFFDSGGGSIYNSFRIVQLKP